MSTDDVLDHQLWAAGDGEYPDRLDLSALAARLLCEQQAVTARWATWAEEVVSGWDGPSGTDATVGDPDDSGRAARDSRSSKIRLSPQP